MAGASGDDMGERLSSIARRHRKSIVTELLDIQSYSLQKPDPEAFIKELECFEYEPNLKRPWSDGSTPVKGRVGSFMRANFDARQERNYVALSYTWEPSEDEDSAKGGYLIQSRNRKEFESHTAKVRDSVFSRINEYMKSQRVKYLWIDRHSVDQKHAKKKQIGVQAMHLVYYYSNHPVALLARKVNSKSELDLLYKLLTGALVPKGQPPKLSKDTSREDALVALQMLDEMTKDKWWTRAWTFQECYRGGEDMALLIPLAAELHRQKRRYQVFGEVSGELCIDAVNFSRQATRLCQAFREESKGTPSETTPSEGTIQNILSTAGRYTQLLDASDPMFPAIISDITKRGIADPWDRLAITANCCYYPVRLDDLKLKENSRSLSLSTLALCLLNGEILNNSADRGAAEDLLGGTVSEYLRGGFYHGFHSPREERNLSFNRGCRFPDVVLTSDGTKTKGHLWKLGPCIDSSIFENLPPCRDECVWHQRLRALIKFLQRRDMMACMSEHLQDLLQTDSDLDTIHDFGFLSFSKQHQLRMAAELMSVVKEGGKLRLGALWDPRDHSAEANPYNALFAWPEERPEDTPAFVFTAISPVKHNGTDQDRKEQHAQDVNRHVSLLVEIDDQAQAPKTKTRIPHLYIRGWLLGLCFFYCCPRISVVFPWPPELKSVEE